MLKYFLAIYLMFGLTATQAEIYRWVDSNGNVSFSDKPHPGAEEITLPKIPTYSSPKIPAEKPVATADEPKKDVYKKISIIQPIDQVTIRNPQGAVAVKLQIKPKLKRGDKAQMIVDGTPTGAPEASTSFSLEGIYRGSHTLSAQVINPKGKILLTSDEITIYMMPPRVGMGGNP